MELLGILAVVIGVLAICLYNWRRPVSVGGFPLGSQAVIHRPVLPPLILIPSYEHPEFTARLLASLAPSVTHGRDARVLVADDGSAAVPPDGPGWDVRRYGKNLGFVEHVNRVVRDEWQGEPLLLLNYDTHFDMAPASWLSLLTSALDARFRSDRAGIVAPMLNWGMWQQVPLNWEDGEGRLAPEHATGWAGAPMFPATVLCGFCLLFHPEFIADRLDRCGWLINPAFSRIAYDDFDLSLWARQHGWTLWVHQAVLVWHEKERDDRAGAPSAAGRAKLAELWGDDVFALLDVPWRMGVKLRWPEGSLPAAWR